MNLGLIGFGRFGQFAARHLRRRIHIFVWDLRDQRKKAAAMGLTWGTLEETASCRFVLLAVPVSEMITALSQVVPYLRPGALLMDVCSVKMAPVEWMTAAVPPEVEVLGIHPLFGPISGRGGIEGLTVALCPGRTRRVELVRRFLSELGLRAIVTTPEEHDRQMARSQAIAHFVARGLSMAEVEEQELMTPAYERLLRVVEVLSRDSPTLFRDLHTYNPFAVEARARLLEALHRIDGQLQEGA